jgi:hypothetical protein
MSQPAIYKTSSEALLERRRLLGLLKLFSAMALTLLAAAYDPFDPGAWALLAVALLGLWFLKFPGWLGAYAARELRLQTHALEEHRQGFTRLILFEQLEQLRVRQGKNEKIFALELHTPQGACVIRGYENMESLFAYLSQHKPESVLIEIEEARVDWQSPMPWALGVLCLGAAALLLFVVLG